MKGDRKYRKSNLPSGAQLVFEGKLFSVYQWEQELYDGTTETFERLSRPDTVLVFPVLPDGRILMINDEQPERDPILTVPSGRIEEGETPEEAAHRELLEETGYEVETLAPFFTEKPFSKMDWVVYGYIGKGAKKVKDAKPDAGEKITPRIVSFEDFLGIASEGKSLWRDLGYIVHEALMEPKKMAELRQKFFD